MKVLHIVNGYWSSSLYSKLIEEIDSIGIEQDVYIPIRHKNHYNKNYVDNLINTKFHYSYTIRTIFHKLFFRYKIYMIQKDIENRIDLSGINLIHAHTLYSDGAVAYQLFKKYKIPYIVAVRNTDLNLYIKYFINLRKYGLEILLNANHIVFISYSYLNHFFDYSYINRHRNKIIKKTNVIYNGVDKFWLNNFINQSKTIINSFKVLYFGEIVANKNIHSVIEAVDRMKEEGYNISFTIIGFGLANDKDYEGKIINLSKSKDYIVLEEHISDKEVLLTKIRNHDCFIMLSHYETFGLVYVEALSQGLPLLYSKDQGFDNIFMDGEVGYSVNSKDVKEIISKLKQLIGNYDNIKTNITYEKLNLFNWKSICLIYKNIYSKDENTRN